MKTVIYQALTLLTLISCANEQTTDVSSEKSSKQNIEGSWKLIYADTKENDSIAIKDLSKTDFIKIINASHFAFFNQEKGTSENFMAGGGTYTFNGTDYTETLDFISASDFRGHVFPFKVEIIGDTLIQQGHEKIEAVGLDRYILEKYIRIHTK